jgi:hypothetical protein
VAARSRPCRPARSGADAVEEVAQRLKVRMKGTPWSGGRGRPPKVVTMQIALPPDDAQENRGTEF